MNLEFVPARYIEDTYTSPQCLDYKNMMSLAFCVVERPFMIWGYDIGSDNAHFLKRIDAHLYYRTAHNIIGAPGEPGNGAASNDADDQKRKDVSSLSRLLWHHGVETLVMILGAYLQAPGAVHAYFLKCRTEDALEIGQFLLREQRPKYHCVINDAAFSLVNILNGIHLHSVWADRDITIDRFARALHNVLRDFASEQHRWEYNSIKHGLRASHGRFGLAIGLEETLGIPAPPEAMQMIGESRDASFFDVAKPLRNATKQQSKIHFRIEKVSVTWSLEKVLCELQLLSILIHNTVSALRIVGGAGPTTVTFKRITDDAVFWDQYFALYAGKVPSASMSIDVNTCGIALPSDKQIYASYRKGKSSD